MKKRKTIWIIDHYSSEPRFGGIQRQFDFANELSRRNYNVVVIASAFSHYTHSYITNDPCHIIIVADHARYAYLHTYPYRTNHGLGRILNMFSFVFAVKKHYKTIAAEAGRPDVVVGASVHPLTWIAAYHIAKKMHIKFIAEVRDLWPEMWLLNGEKRKLDPMVLFFGIIEKWAYKKADKIIYSMLYGDRYICGKLGFPRDKAVLIGQPMDCSRFDRNAAIRKDEIPYTIRAFIKGHFTCVFTGYYMKYEGVHVMLEAARICQEKGLPVQFLFIGSGMEEAAMRSYAIENHLKNVLIHGRVNKELIPAILRACDVCLAHCAKEGHQESFKYGISKNKINEYLYAGKPVIYGRSDKNDPVARCGAGYVVEPFMPDQFAARIEELYHMPPQQRAEYGKRGREYSIKHHRVDLLTDKLLEVYDI